MHLEALKSKQKIIFPELKKFPQFYLVGGTALALQIGHRISIDFDLFSPKEIPYTLLPKIKRIFAKEKISIVVNHSEQLSVKIDGVKIDFVKYNFPIVSKLIEFQGIKILPIKEIAAMKAYALNYRMTLKDYVDLYFVIKNKSASFNDIKKIAEKKYGAEFNFRLFIEQLTYLQDIKKEKIEFLKKSVTEKQIQDFFENEVEKKVKL